MQSSQRLHLLLIQLLFTGHSPKVKVGVSTGHGGYSLKALGLQGGRQHLLGKVFQHILLGGTPEPKIL
jgi:hypothetical protein